MGFDCFEFPLNAVLDRYYDHHSATAVDASLLNLAVNNFMAATVADVSPNMENLVKALVLREQWVRRQMTESSTHLYTMSLMIRFMPMTEAMRGNQYFYFELARRQLPAIGTQLFEPSTRETWQTKGDACLVVGGLFGEYVRATRYNTNGYIPSSTDIRNAGKRAYAQAAGLFNRINTPTTKYRAAMCLEILDNYDLLESSLYAIGRRYVLKPKNVAQMNDLSFRHAPDTKKIPAPSPQERANRARLAKPDWDLLEHGYFN